MEANIVRKLIRTFSYRGILPVAICPSLALALACVPSLALSHHSITGFFDKNRSVGIEGFVTSIKWRNPHTVFEVDVAQPSGEITQWHIETGSINRLRSQGIYREFLKEGDRVKIQGLPSTRGVQELFATNLLLSDGKEIILTTQNKPYFTTRGEGELLEGKFDPEIEKTARLNADGIFRVWSTDLDERFGPLASARLFDGNYPLTDTALAKREAYDHGNPTILTCTKWSMPRLMGNPGPMDFVWQGSDILIRFWEDDNRRLVHMNADDSVVPEEHSLMGYSTGHWEGDTLVIKTTNLPADTLDTLGTPQSSSISIVERFTPTADGNQLYYSLTITDPETFTETFDAERQWIWRPEIIVDEYACGEEQPFG